MIKINLIFIVRSQTNTLQYINQVRATMIPTYLHG